LGADRFETVRNTSSVIQVLANDSTQSALVLASAGTPRFGTTAIVGDAIRYTPAPDMLGTDRFIYQANDGISLKGCQVDGTILYENEIWFPLDEGQGNILRQAGNGPASGTLTTAANPSASWVEGKSGRAIRFNGTNAIANFQNLVLPIGKAPRTLSCWIRTTSVNPPEKQAVFSYGGSGGGQRFTVRLAADNAQPSRHVVKLETGGGTYAGTTRVNDGLWHHVAVSLADRDGSGFLDINECRIHIDGNADPGAVETPGGIFTTLDTTALALGGSDHAQDYNFAGDIDDLRIFPRALDASDVLFLAQHPPVSPEYPQATANPPTNSDNDGVTEPAELTAGTDPDDPNSYPRIDSITKVAGGFRLSWPVVAGRTYEVEESEDLMKWERVAGLAPRMAEVTVPDMTSTLPNTGKPKRFFRLKINLTPAQASQPNNDSDKDGFADMVELVAGTDPADSSSFFRIKSMTMTAGGALLKWEGVKGRRYRVEESPNMADWTLVPGVPHVDVSQNMPDVSLLVPANGAPKRFLRMRVELTPP
jgi:hypothetical protein